MKIYILKSLADHDTSRTLVEWTREDSEVVRDAAERGLSNKQIYKSLRGTRTMTSIVKKKYDMGIRRLGGYTKEEVDIIRDMAEKGASNKQIQEKLGDTRTIDSITKKKHYLGFRRVKKSIEASVQKPDDDNEGEQ